mmetsp:Transcript_26427/g.84043  ORF Transcript_26427/g.84043 Transcript_26427/m.84043 type:complete len:206 (-) Transcript_26427:1247-1864(-)
MAPSALLAARRDTRMGKAKQKDGSVGRTIEFIAPVAREPLDLGERVAPLVCWTVEPRARIAMRIRRLGLNEPHEVALFKATRTKLALVLERDPIESGRDVAKDPSILLGFPVVRDGPQVVRRLDEERRVAVENIGWDVALVEHPRPLFVVRGFKVGGHVNENRQPIARLRLRVAAGKVLPFVDEGVGLTRSAMRRDHVVVEGRVE